MTEAVSTDQDHRRSPSFAALTEGPGGEASREGAEMLHARYGYAAQLAAGRRVLEVGCGPGMGLGLIGEEAVRVVGGDYDETLLRMARDTYGGEIPLIRLDAQALPFQDDAFDMVLFFEGSYYVPDMEKTFDEFARVLAPESVLLFVNANPERPDFIRSPLSVHYHTASEFRAALTKRGFQVTVDGAYPLGSGGIVPRLASTARKVAERLGLIPKTLAGRALLKKLLVRRMVRLPHRIPRGVGVEAPREALPAGSPADRWKVIYVTARRG